MGRFTEEEKQVIYRQRLIEALCKQENTSGGIKFLKDDPHIYIRLFRDQTNDKTKISIGFPRSNVMIPHYASIYKWFFENNIEWRDSIRDGQKYMYAVLNRDPIALERTISSAGKVLFNSNDFHIHIDEHIRDIQSSAMWRYPTLMKACLIIVLFSMVVFPVYELFHIFSLSSPSVDNLDWFEIALLFGFYGVGYNIWHLERKPSVRRSNGWSRKKHWSITLVIWTITVLAALVTV